MSLPWLMAEVASAINYARALMLWKKSAWERDIAPAKIPS